MIWTGEENRIVLPRRGHGVRELKIDIHGRPDYRCTGNAQDRFQVAAAGIENITESRRTDATTLLAQQACRQPQNAQQKGEFQRQRSSLSCHRGGPTVPAPGLMLIGTATDGAVVEDEVADRS